jgi:energy-coupling factor transporter ATP-binding protein EcfA2
VQVPRVRFPVRLPRLHLALVLAAMLTAACSQATDARDPFGAAVPTVSPFTWSVVILVGIGVGALALLGVWAQVQSWRAGKRQAAISMRLGAGLVLFRDLEPPHAQYGLSDEHLRRALLITGRPGAGKTTLLAAIAAGFMQQARASASTRVMHTVCFDASRDVARHIAWLSEHHDRECIVIDIGNPEYATPLRSPRPGHRGAQAFAESIRDAHFPFAAEVPRQMFDALFNTFLLLDAAGYSPEQALRLLLSEAFRRHVLQRGESQLSTHTSAWVHMVEHLPPTEWHRKFGSSLARLFGMLENPYTRALFGGRRGRFDFEQLLDPAYQGPGYDVIVTSSGTFSDEEIVFAFGILFNEFGSVLGANRNRLPVGVTPEIVLLADEIGRYGAPGAVLQIMQTARNTRLRAVFATHSLTSLHERLREQVVLHANRIVGGESGPGAELAAAQLAPYQFDAVATRAPDGRPTGFWSPEAQRQLFLERLATLPDYQFAMRLVNQRETVWVQPLIDFDRQPSELERSEALERAIRQHGCRLSDVLEELESENRTLDRLYGEIRVPAGSDVSDSSDESWRDRPPTDFSPI